MTAQKKIWALLCIIILWVSNLWASDIATFVDLGFSPDGRNYAFAQYGIQTGTLRPWAELFNVDVGRNNFVSGGRVSYTHNRPVVAGQDGSGALYSIITRNNALINRHGVDFLNQGRPIFVSLDDSFSTTRQTVEFRDFVNDASYKATLVSRIEGSGSSLSSSFHIDLERIARDGTRKTYAVGTPTLRRPQIASYRIKKVVCSPSGTSLIMVIEMRRQNAADYDIIYMVEALHP